MGTVKQRTPNLYMKHRKSEKKWSQLSNILVAIATIMILLLSGCDGNEKPPLPRGSVTGQVGKIEPASLLTVRTLTLIEKSHRVWRFEGTNYKGFSPAHLREHKLQGLPITVNFYEEDGTLLIETIID